MAEVFVARPLDANMMRGPFALKRIHAQLTGNDTFVSLFRREAQISLRLHHDNIARTWAVDEADGRLFLVFELIPGETLSQVLKRLRRGQQSLPPAMVSFIGAEIAQGLHYAHTLRDEHGRPLNIIHRDVSPQNILIGFDGAVKLIDFGIAREDRSDFQSTVGTLRGKTQYMSPEQAQGRPVDGRSDIFSLGVVLHESLNAELLFDAVSPFRAIEQVINKTVPELRMGPLPLRRAILRALSRDPEERWRDARQFAKALQEAMAPGERMLRQDVAAFMALLFPERLSYWRQIQAMADAGIGFSDNLELEQADDGAAQPSDGSLATGEEAAPTPLTAVSSSGSETGAPPSSRRRELRTMFRRGAPVLVALLAWVTWRGWPRPSDRRAPPPATPAGAPLPVAIRAHQEGPPVVTSSPRSARVEASPDRVSEKPPPRPRRSAPRTRRKADRVSPPAPASEASEETSSSLLRTLERSPYDAR